MTNFEWLYYNDTQALYDLLTCYGHKDCANCRFGFYCRNYGCGDEYITLDWLADEYIG